MHLCDVSFSSLLRTRLLCRADRPGLTLLALRIAMLRVSAARRQAIAKLAQVMHCRFRLLLLRLRLRLRVPGASAGRRWAAAATATAEAAEALGSSNTALLPSLLLGRP